MAKNMFDLQRKYSKDNQFFTALPPGQTFDTASIKKIRRRYLRRNLAIMEWGLALVPDSVGVENESVDSFYKNPNKISFIRKRKLTTNNIHFYQDSTRPH